MTRSRGDERGSSSAGATQVLDHDPITAIIPLDELEARLDATYAETWVEPTVTVDHDDAWGGGSHAIGLDYRPTHSEVTQDLMIPEGLFGERPFHSEGLTEVESAPSALLAEPAEAPEDLLEAPELPGTTTPVRRAGKHRLAAPPHALKGRAALVALAAGASMAGAAVVSATDAPRTAQQPVAPSGGPAAATAPGAARQAPLPAPQDMGQFAGALAAGKDRKAADDQIVIDALRPKVIDPVPGASYTSGFGVRWGSMHAGIDLAAPLGTPILAATDGVVVEAGPASGFGIWIQVKLSDGTIMVYGHMYNVNVHPGQHVKAGDLISWVGNNGQSTGPHCHVEVWQPGGQKIDPQPWFAERGVNVGTLTE